MTRFATPAAEHAPKRSSHSGDGLRLHPACGDKHIPGFFHLDAHPAPHVDQVGRVEDLSFLCDKSVELIYASHVLEHFDRTTHLKVLAEWFRVLCDGGVLRLAVPDFARVAELYGCYGDINLVIGLVCGGQRNELDFHRMIFDYASLSRSLGEVGFSEVRRWDWRKTSHAEIDDYSQTYLPHRNHADKDNGVLVSLNVEAVK